MVDAAPAVQALAGFRNGTESSNSSRSATQSEVQRNLLGLLWTMATTGFPERGSRHPRSAFSGPQVIGAGEAVRSFSMKDIGAQRWVSTAASTMASATAVLVMRAAAGKVVTFPTILT